MSWQAVTTQPCELGESPFWHPQEQMLYWVDIPGKKIMRTCGATGPTESWLMTAPHALEPGCIAPARQGGLVIALRDGIYRARTWGSALQLLVPFAHDTTTTRFNDGKCDPCGRFWVGTMYEPRDARKAALFSIDCRQGGRPQVELKADNAITANGLAWSPDRKTVYWSDTPNHIIRAWDWDETSNVMSAPRVFHQFPAKPQDWQYGMAGYGGRPDGAAVDVQGNYFVAMYEGRRLLKLSPAGDILADIPTPAQCPTMPCFGDDDLRTLYLTTARHKRSAAELADMPLSGCVFSMRMDVPGLPVNFFSD
ncbi:MAG: SMP-30/gluconolactonase/LRE family protein [Rhodoferax sp.]|uniref:SMP-30/gluconolactonase/LRE family protein n=1 Tax=Rhodoferax sp. TaxID=50421 RepID=UPI00271A357F|nr:SMP-30/gluconolactonase/LRE family protein [Rhodoferax sp.]MDO8449530.1 SMP-30/gluconolactonase/LRE family protein [Rhodoferax sp.]